MIRKIGFVLLLSVPVWGAVTGTVINRSTGQPQAGATVGLNRLGQNGIELIDQAKSDAQGKFTINQDVQGPHLLRTAFDGVTYNHMLPPGSPTAGLTIEVFNSSKQQGEAKVSKHMILFEPNGEQMVVNETFILANDGKSAWNDPDKGTLRFFVPASISGEPKVEATAPGGMPIGAALVKTSQANVYAVDFPVKPGETRFDVSFTAAYKAGAPYQGKVVTKDENTYLISPNGITLAGDNLKDLGTEPRTQAHIYGLQADRYQIQLTGSEIAPPAEAAAAAADGDAGQQSDGGPQIEQIMPRIYGQSKVILGLALGILALGFALLYRHPGPKEANERGRR